jgi:hypothetical protein
VSDPSAESGTPDEAIRFQMRDLAVTLEGHPEDQRDALLQLVNHAGERPELRASVRLTLTRSGARGRSIVEEGGPGPRNVCCDEVALGHILQRLTTRLLDLYPDTTCLHCGAASIDGRLALFTGDRGAGKTTLLLRLLQDGAAFHCDEMILARDGRALTLPRRLHVKPGTLTCLPELADACGDKLLLKIGLTRFYPLDPAELGYSWASAEAVPAAIFHLEPAFDGPPGLTPIAQIEMVKRLMCQTLTGPRDVGCQAADICSIVRGTPCFSLRVGDLNETSALVRRTVEVLPVRPS